MNLEGWTSWDRQYPPGVLCQFWREGWDKPIVCKRSEFAPETNIVGLYWRLTGIGREQFELMSAQGFQGQAQWEALASFWQMDAAATSNPYARRKGPQMPLSGELL